MKKKTWMIIGAAAAVGAIAIYYLRKPKDEKKVDEMKQEVLSETTPDVPGLATPGITAGIKAPADDITEIDKRMIF